MATKVYWKGLTLTLDRSRRYIGRWSAKLESNLTTEQFAKVQAAYNAILECLAVLPPNTPDP